MKDQIDNYHYDVVVIGGGMAGVCAALASARQGARTGLLQDRPVLGGNSSAEIGVKIQGADELGHYRFSRETGIINELFERNVNFPNPLQSPSIWSLVLWEACREQERLDVYLNTLVRNPTVENGRIVRVDCEQPTTERAFTVSSTIFIDCSGDGRVAAEAGAPFMMGREAKDQFGETLAEPVADGKRMGCTIYMRVRDMGQPIPFKPPPWIHIFKTDDDFPGGTRDAPHKLPPLLGTGGGYWWIEYGGELEPFADAETVRDELYRYALGVWDHIKNQGDHGADNLVLEHVGWVPGRRDSRRFIGDYIMTQEDAESCRVFPDAVAYGGWHIDLHNPKGVAAAPDRYWKGHLLRGRHTIPFRCLYAKTINNLMFAGRNISTSHVAMGTTRVMATCAVMGQAVGSAAALCIENRCTPRQVGSKHIRSLQQRLLAQDCYIPGGKRDVGLAAAAIATASSEATLVFPPRESWYAIPQKIAQSFIISGDQLDSVRVPLRNETNHPITVTLHLREGLRIDDFNNQENLLSVEQELSPGEHDILFSLPKRTLTPDTVYWVCLEPASEGVSCGYSQQEPPATQAGKFEPQIFETDAWFMRRIRGAFAIRLTPPTHCFGPREVLTGVTRPESRSNVWISEASLPQSLILTWDQPTSVSVVELVFDNNLDLTRLEWCSGGSPTELVRDCAVYAQVSGQRRRLFALEDNTCRIVRRTFESVTTTAITVEVTKTWGSDQARIVEVRVDR
ncbi:MAG: FAD-dependent oxidoreductase [Phycisphaeraceae bacterium]|nr:FAD-dependent oxidoreductase [Phycisphaeraceae bacterium]